MLKQGVAVAVESKVVVEEGGGVQRAKQVILEVKVGVVKWALELRNAYEMVVATSVGGLCASRNHPFEAQNLLHSRACKSRSPV